jgi:hypothetical protein
MGKVLKKNFIVPYLGIVCVCVCKLCLAFHENFKKNPKIYACFSINVFSNFFITKTRNTKKIIICIYIYLNFITNLIKNLHAYICFLATFSLLSPTQELKNKQNKFLN